MNRYEIATGIPIKPIPWTSAQSASQTLIIEKNYDMGVTVFRVSVPAMAISTMVTDYPAWTPPQKEMVLSEIRSKIHAHIDALFKDFWR